MNFGTKLRTIARIAASLHTAVYAVTVAVADLGFGKLTIAWTIFTIVVDFAVAFFTTYYNNDYTIEGEVGTITTREMKAHREDVAFYDDEVIFDDYDE